MKIPKTIQDILKVSISNIAILLSGVLVGFLLPRMIGVTEYGYYKTYTLYATYVGMFHFGISDGIYLKFGGVDYSSLSRSKFRYYTTCFAKIEISLSLVLAAVSLLLLNGEYRFIFLFLAIYLFFHNLTIYFQMISQATCRFKELSTRNVLQSVCISSMVILLWICNSFYHVTIGYKCYVILYSIIVIAMAYWYLFTYQDIAFGNNQKDHRRLTDIIGFIGAGFPLMLANLCVSLILTLDRQFVNILFDMDTYATYAFAYNMLALVTTATSAISLVIYPKLKQMDPAFMRERYSSLISVVLCLVYGCLCIYFPLNLFVNWFLPSYSASLVIFRIIFPGLAISSAIMIVMHNYYKALAKTKDFFFKSIVVLVVSGIANAIAYLFFHTTVAISIASIITMVFWYLFIEHYFVNLFVVKWVRNFLYMVAMMFSFYAIVFLNNIYLEFVVYILLYTMITCAFFYKQLFRQKRHNLVLN